MFKREAVFFRWLPAVCIVLGVLGSTPVSAVTYIGFTNGCFSLSCPPPSTSALQTASIGGLTYTNSTFDVTSVAGSASIGDLPALPNVDNLGSFSLTGNPFTYTGETFQLRVTFTAPPGTNPASTVETALLTGQVESISVGSLVINFDNSATHFTFTGGSFDLFVNDVALTPGGTIALSGFIIEQASLVPVPGALPLFATGLGALGLLTWRKKRKAIAA